MIVIDQMRLEEYWNRIKDLRDELGQLVEEVEFVLDQFEEGAEESKQVEGMRDYVFDTWQDLSNSANNIRRAMIRNE